MLGLVSSMKNLKGMGRRAKWPRKVRQHRNTPSSIPRDLTFPIITLNPGAAAMMHFPSAPTPTRQDTLHDEHPLTYFLNAAKSRTIAVRLISMAMTGYYRTMIRPRIHRPLSMLKYDPVVKKKVLFLEATKGGKAK
ncbi:mitochondrial 54S ribosomal protein YmL39 [Penicillium waksmanii]|uniref:mitochondrial 54S ribosomal protein YmL39 n=1 Tax=Penicillium waksmanii TaxID=69791 RepID=UPI002546E1D2|nr:mitochondrial 54S ribosomal protein YmL39 [Penicillium waksmanii]KAJ5983568.1 mitochondrial 54S ribosomal protein YmL39 [Penicillium waksmanii]